jgi:hypothetical protein
MKVYKKLFMNFVAVSTPPFPSVPPPPTLLHRTHSEVQANGMSRIRICLGVQL